MGQMLGTEITKPETVPWKYHIYVTNQTKDVKHIFVRVRGDKLQESEVYSRILRERSLELSGEAEGGAKAAVKVSDKHEAENKDRVVFNSLTQGGFNLLPRGETLQFAVENDDRLMYLSVHDGNKKMWVKDIAVNAQSYGCVTVKGDQTGISVGLSNPEPRWIECKEQVDDGSFPTGLVQVHRRPDNIPVYVARIMHSERIDFDCVFGVWRENGKLCRDDDPLNKPPNDTEEVNVLLATGYEWVKAVRGNPIPPNAVKTSIWNGRHRIYVGRMHGDKACAMSDWDGVVNGFMTSQNTTDTSGEVLLLTAEPTDLP